jgi:hypothetical protein
MFCLFPSKQQPAELPEIEVEESIPDDEFTTVRIQILVSCAQSMAM